MNQIKRCSQNKVVSAIKSFGESQKIQYLQTLEMPPPSLQETKLPAISSTLSIKESAKIQSEPVEMQVIDEKVNFDMQANPDQESDSVKENLVESKIKLLNLSNKHEAGVQAEEKINSTAENKPISSIQSFDESQKIPYLQVFEMPPPSLQETNLPAISSTLSIKESAKIQSELLKCK